jgi:hypothetical protein
MSNFNELFNRLISDDAITVKQKTVGTMVYDVIRSENSSGKVLFHIVRFDKEKNIGEFYRFPSIDEKMALRYLNQIVIGLETFYVMESI